MKLTVIGAGNMGGAIIRGLTKSAIIKASEITCADLSKEKLEAIQAFNPKINISSNNHEAVKGADLIILSVKPWLIETIIYEIKSVIDFDKQVILSIAAGITFEHLLSYLDSDRRVEPTLFRLIPNIAIEVKESMSFLSSYNASSEQKQQLLTLFNELGSTLYVEESLMDAGTALASCGIAFAFRYIRASMEGGIEMGLPAEEAKKVVLQTMIGAAKLLQSNGNHPEQEIDRVTTPGGITIRGLNEMEHAGFTSAIIKGLKACK